MKRGRMMLKFHWKSTIRSEYKLPERVIRSLQNELSIEALDRKCL